MLRLLGFQLALIVGMVFVMSIVAAAFRNSPQAGNLILFGVALAVLAGDFKILQGIMGVIGTMRQLITTRW